MLETNLRIPPRSLFYVLEPIGIGTGLVESFTSYLMRLAASQELTVREAGALAFSANLEPCEKDVPSLYRAHVVNGSCERAAEWVDAFEKAASRVDLRCLTLIAFQDSLPNNFLRSHRAWCPSCLEEWSAAGTTIYEPLLWSFKDVKVCPAHGCCLAYLCLHCGKRVKALGSFSRPGRCESCRGWLGDSNPRSMQSGCSDAERKVTTDIFGLLKILPSIDSKDLRSVFHHALSFYHRELAGGNLCTFAHYIRRSSAPMVWKWLQGIRFPCLRNLLIIASSLNVPLSSFFDPSGPTSEDMARAVNAVRGSKARHVQMFRRPSDCRLALIDALSDPKPCRLSEVAMRLGYTSNNRLYAVDRDLCLKIKERFRSFNSDGFTSRAGKKGKCKPAEIKVSLESAVASRETTTLIHIARMHGYATTGEIRKQFPDLCAAVTAKNEAYKFACRQEARQVLEASLREHPAPSLRSLCRSLRYNNPSLLVKYEPELTGQVINRYRMRGRDRADELKTKALSAMEDYPCASVTEICRHLEINPEMMDRHAPELRSRMARLHREWARSNTRRRHKELHEDVLRIAFELVRQGIYPSMPRILKLLAPDHLANWKVYNEAFREARKALADAGEADWVRTTEQF